jgi:hypothetical protein
VAKAGPPRNRSALDLGEADVQAETAQHPDEPEAGQEGPATTPPTVTAVARGRHPAPPPARLPGPGRACSGRRPPPGGQRPPPPVRRHPSPVGKSTPAKRSSPGSCGTRANCASTAARCRCTTSPGSWQQGGTSPSWSARPAMIRSTLNGRQPQEKPRHKSPESRMPGKLARPVRRGRTEKDPRTAGTSPYGLPNLRLRDMQRDCAVICLPLQHYFSVASLPVMQTPCCLEPHDGFAVCPECRYRDTAVVKPPFIITVPPFRERLACSPRSAGCGDVIES